MAAFFCGKSGIQTHGTARPYAGFRVRSIRSLWHLSISGCKDTQKTRTQCARIKLLQLLDDLVCQLGIVRTYDYS